MITTISHGVIDTVRTLRDIIYAIGGPALVICACVMCIYITRLCMKYLKR